MVLLIAVGESILAVGATFSGLRATPRTMAAFVTGFVVTAALALVADPLLLTAAVGVVTVSLAVWTSLHPPLGAGVGSPSAVEVMG